MVFKILLNRIPVYSNSTVEKAFEVDGGIKVILRNLKLVKLRIFFQKQLLLAMA